MLSAKRRQAWLDCTRVWDEQVSHDKNRWWAKLEAATANTGDAGKAMDELGGHDELVRRMADAGACWPPTDSDWRKHDIEWDATPRRRALQQVSDTEIQAALYFLNDATEQRDRIKSVVLLCEMLGCSPDNFTTYRTHLVWRILWTGENIDFPEAEKDSPVMSEDEITALVARLRDHPPDFDRLIRVTLAKG